MDFLYLADCAAVDHLDGAAKLAAEFGALLAAGLKDDFVFLYLIDHAAALGDGEGNGFFAVDVLAGAGGEYGGFTVPVVWGGD